MLGCYCAYPESFLLVPFLNLSKQAHTFILAQKEQLKYLQKLKINDVELLYTLNKTLRSKLFTLNIKRLPEVCYPDDYHYLVDKVCIYTRDEEKSCQSGCLQLLSQQNGWEHLSVQRG